MATRKPCFAMVLMVVLVCSVGGSDRVEAQCVVANTATDMLGATITVVSKTLSASDQCTSLPTQMNAVVCNPGSMGAFTNLLTAEAMAATMNPQCVWVCDCDTPMNPGVTIDGSDGLPVELMDFAIEDDLVEVPREESGERVTR